MKPDLCAPGGLVVSALSSGRRATVPDSLKIGTLNAEEYTIQAGTSMAAPQVAGAVALLLARPDSAWSSASPSRIRDRLVKSARRDLFTGTVPNDRWGSGKLDIEASLKPVRMIRMTAPPNGAIFNSHWPWAAFQTGGLAFDSVWVELYSGGCSGATRVASFYDVPAMSSRTFTYLASIATNQAFLKVTGFYGALAPGVPYRVENVSDGLFALNLPPTGVEPSSSSLEFALHGNTPNPFNPKTTIAIESDVDGAVSLQIFSIDGRLVRTLLKQHLAKGKYEIPWDGTNEQGHPVSSGAYLYMFHAGQRSATKKMVLIR